MKIDKEFIKELPKSVQKEYLVAYIQEGNLKKVKLFDKEVFNVDYCRDDYVFTDGYSMSLSDKLKSSITSLELLDYFLENELIDLDNLKNTYSQILLEAIRDNNFETINKVYSKSIIMNCHLNVAITANNTIIIDKCLKSGCNFNADSLKYAYENKNVELCIKILKSEQSKISYFPIVKDLDFIKKIETKFSIDKNKLLAYACERGVLKTVKYAIENGADLNKQHDTGFRKISIIKIAKRHHEVYEYLKSVIRDKEHVEYEKSFCFKVKSLFSGKSKETTPKDYYKPLKSQPHF